MSGREDDRLAAALRYAEHGWPVFPCVPGEKAPVTRRGFLDASTDPERVTSWWSRNPDRNVAIATGAPGPDVLDVDRYRDGSGFPALRELKQAGLVPAPQAMIRTPRGGAHLYYAGTDQRNGHLARHHIDYRAAGGYVVAPPSAVAGRRYEVVHHEPSAATFDWGAARDHLEPQARRQPQRAPERDSGRPREVRHLAAWVAAQPEGNRNAGLFWAANRAVEAGDTATLGELHKAAQTAGLDAREADRTIRSAQRGAESRPFAEREKEAG
ncbi:MAG: bifunctional DNA primase/polymerase [Streptosporangiaceae bacterium]